MLFVKVQRGLKKIADVSYLFDDACLEKKGRGNGYCDDDKW